MGKVDEMRRQREAQYAKDHPAVPAPAGADPAAAVEDEAAVDDDRAAAAADTGACAVCGKVRPLRGGRVSSHQKGLGKLCAGSNRPPR